MQSLEEMQTSRSFWSVLRKRDIKMLNHVVLVHLYWLCRTLHSLHPGGGHRDSCYTASTLKNSWRNPTGCCFPAALLHVLRESTVPKAIHFSQQFRAHKNHLELVCCSKSFMKDELLETWESVLIQTQRCDGSCGNNCSSPKQEKSHSRTGEAPKMSLSYLWPCGQTHISSTHDIRQSCF